jgi:hypothetical protein
LLTLGIALRGAIDLTDPGSFIRAATSPTYVPAWTIVIVGAVLNLYGFLGLYRYLTYRAENMIAFLAVVVRTAGIVLFLPFATFFAINGPVIAEPYQQGNQEVIAILEANFVGPGLAMLGLSAVGAVIGWLLFAVVMWRDGRLPKWVVVLFAAGLPLEAFPVNLPTELFGVVLLLISTVIIAWIAWQESAAAILNK